MTAVLVGPGGGNPVVDQGQPGPTPWPVSDRDLVLEVLDDLTGPGVLTFTFAGDVPASPWVHADGDTPVRATGPDQMPTASLGVPIPTGSPFPLPFVTATVRVLAGDRQTVTVYGTR